MSEKKSVFDLNDLELADLITQTYENLMREQQNLVVLQAELQKRKGAKKNVVPSAVNGQSGTQVPRVQ